MPQDRRFGVFVYAEFDGQTIALFWDGLEEMVSLLWGEDKIERQTSRCSHFRNLSSLREKMTAATEAVCRDEFRS